VEAKKAGRTAFATPNMAIFSGMFVEIAVTDLEEKA
jgi:hypothetical protein